MEVSTGAKSYAQAIADATSYLADSGVTTVTYLKNGNVRHDQVDVAVRRAVLTSVNQTAARIQLARMKEMGCDYVEVTAHFGARESHSHWQGGVYRVSTGEFERETGYGSMLGLCGINCRHNFFPFFPDISKRTYTDGQLDEMENKVVRLYGEEVSQFTAEQAMRKVEREIRGYKRDIIGQTATMGNASSGAVFDAAQRKYQHDALMLAQKQNDLDEIAAETGLTINKTRLYVGGFGRSEAQKAAWTVRKAG